MTKCLFIRDGANAGCAKLKLLLGVMGNCYVQRSLRLIKLYFVCQSCLKLSQDYLMELGG